MHVRGPALEPRRAERLDQRVGQVRVHGHAGHERAPEAVLARDLLVVDLVFGARGRVPGLDVILGQALLAIRMGLLHYPRTTTLGVAASI